MILGKKNFITVTILAVIMAGLGLFYIHSQTLNDGYLYHGGTPPERAKVAVAKVAIEKGELLRREDLKVREVPRQFLPDDPVLDSDLFLFVGAPLEAAVDEGAMLLVTDFYPEQFDLDDLSIDERALKIDGDAIFSMAASIRPRDYIDVMVTLTDEEFPRSLMLLQRVQVVEVEDKWSSRSITLAVTAQEAEMLAIFQTEAKLHILSRDADDEEYTQSVSMGWQEELWPEVHKINRERVERNLSSKPGATSKVAMEISRSSIRTLPSNLRAGSQIDFLGITDPERLAIEPTEGGAQPEAFTLLQSVQVLATRKSITVSVTHEEAHLLSIMQAAMEFHILARNPESFETIPIEPKTVKDALENLEELQQARQKRHESEDEPEHSDLFNDIYPCWQ